MLFNSLDFIIFFPIVTTLYFLIPHKYRWLLLLLASVYFYVAFIPYYIFILIALILIDYTLALVIESSTGKKRKLALIGSILATCAVLFVFKYYGFFNQGIAWVTHFFNYHYAYNPLWLILPIGLSFHTFQSLSYVIEVYLGRQKAERNIGIYALYVMFYPQLVAGPIERPQNLLHQFREKHSFSYENAVHGLTLMLWGMFKKVVLADNLALFVNTVFNTPTHYTGVSLIVASLFFALQIYFDFSGYSDIARGSAKFMGFDLMINFKQPYFSKSLSEFWRRWHISLSTWFKDYVYIPLGGSKGSESKTYINTLITFTVSGLWHGANITFVIWGFMNGLYLVIQKRFHKLFSFLHITLSKIHASLPNIFETVCVFFLISFTFIFFRAKDLADSLYIIKHLFAGLHETTAQSFLLGQTSQVLWILIITLIATLFLEWRQFNKNEEFPIANMPSWLRWSVCYMLVLAIIFIGVYKHSQFIYFQF